MSELVILSFESQESAAKAREHLLRKESDDLLVLPDLDSIRYCVETPSRPPGRMRRWVALPWRLGSKALGASLTVITWMSLISGAITGELAGRLLGLDENHDLRQQIARAVPPNMEPVIVLVRGDLTPGLIEELEVSHDQVYRTIVSADAVKRIQSALAGILNRGAK